MHRILYFAVLSLWISSCASRPGVSSRELQQRIADSPVFAQSFTGFALYDTERDETIYEYQADKYYTPASNTKIFTLYAGLKLLSDSIPALRYEYRGDTLIFTGTGDPTLLHPEISSIDTTYNQAVFQFLKRHLGPLRYLERPTADPHFGPGWAWEDYGYNFSTERSVLPLHANVARFRSQRTSAPVVSPTYFRSTLSLRPDTTQDTFVRRALHDNRFTYALFKDTTSLTTDIPFIQSASLTLDLLRDTLERPVGEYQRPYFRLSRRRYSVPADSLYRRMMQQSDNFVAEQILMMCSSSYQDTLSARWTIEHMKGRYLDDLPDSPVWVDGSGLSRYNLQTPRTMVALLQKVDSVLSDRRIRTIFPAGGVSGTIEDWYAHPNGAPYVFAKTGTLGGKHCLSGFLFTQSGRKLIFSFMHNNYVTTSSVFKAEMERILAWLYEAY